MKLNLLVLSFFLTMFTSQLLTAQEIKFPEMDKSPMDAANYPDEAAYVNYLAEDNPNRKTKIKVIYGRPYKKGRKVFGELQKFGEEWRLGANECTEITFYQSVVIGGTTVPAGRYCMFADVHEKYWMIKLSKQLFIAGTKNRDKTQDIVATKVMTSKLASVEEQFTIGFQKVDEGMVNMIFEWDQTQAVLPINLNAPVMDGEDKSPMDYAYYPNRSRLQNFLKPEEVDANQPIMRVLYSRPQMKGRKIFGELLKYDEMWRLGANKATKLTLSTPITIGGKEVAKGEYSMQAIPAKKGGWTIIINSDANLSGLSGYKKENDVVRINAKAGKSSFTETFTIGFDNVTATSAIISIKWAKVNVQIPFTVNTDKIAKDNIKQDLKQFSKLFEL